MSTVIITCGPTAAAWINQQSAAIDGVNVHASESRSLDGSVSEWVLICTSVVAVAPALLEVIRKWIKEDKHEPSEIVYKISINNTLILNPTVADLENYK